MNFHRRSFQRTGAGEAGTGRIRLQLVLEVTITDSQDGATEAHMLTYDFRARREFSQPQGQEAEAAASGQSFASQDALDTLTTSWPMDRFVTVWNSFAGVAGFGVDLKLVKKFQNRNAGDSKIGVVRETASA